MASKEEAGKSDINPRRVFLVSGQLVEQKVGGREGISPTVTQRVVIAEDPSKALQRLAEAEPSFRPLGHASLADYEDAAARLRAVTEGRSTEWSVLPEG
ncbi:hypothetical protein AU476_15190 [Cupriavidus sp. UYMSc13B]|nr:hypothetical protein AU476_15190 [Cupriavidus sp. UYMSc13B]